MNSNKEKSSKADLTIDIDKLRQKQMQTQANITGRKHKTEELEEQRLRRQKAKEEIIRKIKEEDSTTVIKTTKLKNEPLDKQFTHKIQLIKEKRPEKKGPPERILHDAQEVVQEKLSYTLQMEAVSTKQVAAYKKRKNRKTGININDKFVDLGPRIERIYLAVTVPLILIISVLLYIKFL